MLNEIINTYAIISPLFVSIVLAILLSKTTFFGALNIPIDHGRCMKDGNRILGDKKTWRSLLAVSLFSGLTFYIFVYMMDGGYIVIDSFIQYGNNTTLQNSFYYGLLWGLAYYISEIFNSYIKRRESLSISKILQHRFGRLLLDRVDAALGASIASYFFISDSTETILLIFTAISTLHIVANGATTLKKKPNETFAN